MHWASVELLVDRAQAVRPDFQVTEGNAQAVSELCYRLDGIPLALELAAARAQVMTPAQMVAELEHRFDFLVSRKRDVEHRHQTLRAAMEWSYRLLSPQLQRLFAGLSIFRGGWTAQAAEAVCGEPQALEHLEELRECSLILAEQTQGEIRFRMLETLREYAAEQLDPEEDAALRHRHAEYYLALAEKAEPKLKGEHEALWLDKLETEHDNLRAALAWFKSAEDGAEPHLRLAKSLGSFWDTRGYYKEGRTHLEEALAREGVGGPTTLRAGALIWAAWLAVELLDYATASSLCQESLEIAQGLEDKKAVARALSGLAHALSRQGAIRRDEARALYERCMAIHRELDDRGGISAIFHSLALLHISQARSALCPVHEYEAALHLQEQSVAIMREVGSKSSLAKGLWLLGMAVDGVGDTARAVALTEEAYALAREVGDKWMVLVTARDLAELARKRGDHETADAFEEERRIYTRQLYGDGAGPSR